MPTKKSLRCKHGGLEQRERKRPMMGSEAIPRRPSSLTFRQAISLHHPSRFFIDHWAARMMREGMITRLPVRT
jgi:hypothetical protein